MLLTTARELCDQPHRQNKAISYEKAKIFTPSEINLGPKKRNDNEDIINLRGEACNGTFLTNQIRGRMLYSNGQVQERVPNK